MDLEKALVDHRLKNAGESLNKVYSSVVDMQADMRNYSREFYYRISLLSGGILSLDITFIGYLSSKSVALNYAELLYTSWFCLVLALIGSLYRNYYNLDMGHYQTMDALNKARLEQQEAMLKMLKISPESIANVTTREELNKQIETTESNISKLKKAIKHNKDKEKMNSRSWIITQYMAHFGFVVGLILTAIFAAINLPVKLDFPIIHFLLNLR
ncbi:MAG TPA: hypothetical protein VLE21_03460 [Candidatus Nitrosocosmicus sp.]|nr:hypothetical protein [Candidatus Nitrosocosmicus sp.]